MKIIGLVYNEYYIFVVVVVYHFFIYSSPEQIKQCKSEKKLEAPFVILLTETLSLKYNIVLEEYEFLVLQRLCIMMVFLEELFTVSRVHEEY